MKTRHRLVLLVLSLSAVSPVFAAVHIWTGAASSLVSDGANWRGGSPAGDAVAELAFPAGVSRLTVTNDVPGLTLRSIAFSGSGYSIGGQALTLVSGAEIIDSTEGPNEVSCDLHLSGGATLHRQGSVYQDAALMLSGAISGAGPVVKLGSGRTIFSGARPNTYTGGTQVLHGELRLAKADGIDAVPGDLLIGTTGWNDERGQVTTVASQQIADTATIRISESSSLGVGRTEAVGPLEVQGGARVGTSLVFSGDVSSEGTLILRGDVTIFPGFNEATFYGDLVLDGNRTFTSCDTCSMTRFSCLRDYAPVAGLILRGGKFDISRSSYHGPTVIDGASATIDNLNTAVRMMDGRFSGHVASLVTEGGTVDASAFRGVTTVGDLRLGAWTNVLLFLGAEGPRLIAGGTLDPGHAKLLFTGGSVTRILGNSYVVAVNGGSGPMRTFDNLPEGAVISDRFRVSYTGGDGNDLKVTEVGRFATSTFLAADPALLDVGQSITLTATVSSFEAPIGLPSQVTFREGSTVVGSALLNAGRTASLALQPSFGEHTYTATFSGTSGLQPSTSDPARVTVRPAGATLTSVEPATITAGTTVTLTLRGSDFLPGGYVSVSPGATLIPAVVSPTEVNATWAVPGGSTAYPAVIAYVQPLGPRSNSLIVQVVAPAKTVLTFEPRAITGPVAAGGGAAWLSIARRSRPDGSAANEHRSAVTPDTDRDGIARWEQPDDVPATGLWLMTDMLDGKVWSGRPDGFAPPARPLPSAMFLRDPDGHYTHVIFSHFSPWTLLWVRPGVGAWTLFGGDGYATDLDGGFNGRWVINTSQMQPVGNSPAAPPAGVEAGDTWLAMSEDLQQTWAGDRVDAHLGEASGPGTLSVALDGSTVNVAESAGTARLTVLRTGGTDGQVSIDYKTVDYTAAAGLQYEARAGRLTFGPGEILKTIEVPIINDSAYAASSTFRIVLSEPAGTTITGLTTIDVAIQDDDPPPQLSMSESVSVTEGDDGRREATFTVSISGTLRFPVTVPWSYGLASDRASGEPLSPGDFGTLTFLPGGPRSQTITVRYDANRIPQEDRVFRVALFKATNALPSRIERLLTVVDDDFPEITILDASVSEAQDRVRVTIASTQLSYKALSVRYNTASGSATEGSDFTATSGTADLRVTRGNYVVDIPIVADSAAEGDEFFTVVLSDAKNARIRRAAATVVIVDDESGALPAITGASIVLTESGGAIAHFRFGLSFPVAREVRFHVTTVAGSATAGEDFLAVSQTVVFPAGSTEAFLNVPILDDLLNESTETFSLQLSEPDGATIATPTLTVTLFDQELVEIAPNAVRIGAANVEVPEGNTGSTPVRFTIRLSRASNVPITVAYATADGSAVAPADYTAAAGTLTFAAGETEKTVDVAVIGDRDYEADETFTLVLGNPTNAILDPAAATCRVLNDEAPPVHRRSAGR
ncbi:MAG: large repetitive protein [Acidobacteriota bacterium]|jgi:autotransporter-associated beta strand protein|nr:large repetitive protein [Acidobacteriota bacterium]